jgi:hypothetical protein
MGEVFDYMCAQPGLDANLQGYLTNAANNYNTYGNVNQGGSTYTGGGGYGGGSGGGGYTGGGGASNAQIVQQVTQNYNYQEINDNHIDILGPVNGDIDIDQDNDDVDVTGDGNAVNTGEGDQNAATGDGSSAAQANGDGDAVSNSGDGAIDAPVNTGTFTGTQNDDGTVENSPVGDGNQVVDLENADIDDAALGFGEGDTGNVSGNYLEEGAAASGTGDATGQSVDTNVQSDVNTEHGPGDNAELDGFGGVPVRQLDTADTGFDTGLGGNGDSGRGDDGGHDGGGNVNDSFSDNLSPQVEVNVEGGDGDQSVHDLDPADA